MKTVYGLGLLSLLSLGLIINYILDYDFLNLSGIDSQLIVVSLIFFILKNQIS